MTPATQQREIVPESSEVPLKQIVASGAISLYLFGAVSGELMQKVQIQSMASLVK